MSKTPPNTLVRTGASSGDVLLGIHPNGNLGLLIQVFEEQPTDHGGRIRGPFRVLHEGKGKYASGIRSVIDERSFFGKADEFIRLVSAENGCADCTHVLNANALWRLDPASILEKIVNIEDEQIRRCPDCGQTYDDLSLNFCLQDGSRLTSELAEVETVVQRHPPSNPVRKRPTEEIGIEYIRNAVAKHPNLGVIVHPGSNHRITKSGKTGSMWIIPRYGGVSITVNGQAARQMYREMERLFGKHHREDAKGYRYYQANEPLDVELMIETWSKA